MVDITPLLPPGRQVVESYGGGRFRVSGQEHEGSVLVLPDRTLPWTVTDFSQITLETLAPLLASEPKPEVLLVGCGLKLQRLQLELRTALKQAGIGSESMDTGAACRTYNVLLAEGRAVAAALIAV